MKTWTVIQLTLMHTTKVAVEIPLLCLSLTLNDNHNWEWSYLRYLRSHLSFYKCIADELRRQYSYQYLRLIVVGAAFHLRHRATTRHRRAHPKRPPSLPVPPCYNRCLRSTSFFMLFRKIYIFFFYFLIIFGIMSLALQVTRVLMVSVTIHYISWMF